MEYTYQNSPGEKKITICLQANDMIVITDKTTRTIPYIDITEIKLIKRRDLYFSHISTLHDKTILTSSQIFGQTGDRINQSKDYLAVARTMHVRLFEKSKANSMIGFSLKMLFFLLIRSATLASFLFLTEEYILRCTRKSFGRDHNNTFIWQFIGIRFAAKSLAKVQ